MAEPSLTTLIDIGDEIEGGMKWSAFVDGGDGFFYGIPYNARRVVKFNPFDKPCTTIRTRSSSSSDASYMISCSCFYNLASILASLLGCH